MRAGFLCPKCNNFACLHTRQDQNALHQKMPKRASSVSRSQGHLAKWKPIGWSIGFNSWTNWTLYSLIPRSLCKIRLNDVSEMFNCCERWWIDVDGASRTLSATTEIFSGVRSVFGSSPLVYRWGCQFLSLLSHDNEHTELTVLLCFQNPYAIFAHFLQHYPDFQSNIAALFKRIPNHIR